MVNKDITLNGKHLKWQIDIPQKANIDIHQMGNIETPLKAYIDVIEVVGTSI